MNYQRVLEDVNQHAIKFGRDPDEIKVIAVSKNQPLTNIERLNEMGCQDFGENRIQEALLKIEASKMPLKWHFIGPLQKNKVRKAIGKFDLIHSVDSPELVSKISEISQECSLKTSLLLQVNISDESSKQGFSPESLLDNYGIIAQLPSIKIEGLMTMAPFVKDEKLIRRCFSTLYQLKEKLGLKHLSMGMSQDYHLAIEEGATMLRIGSAIFENNHQ